MSNFYNPQRKTRIFNPESKEPFIISRTKIELFMNCHQCFYLDCRLGVSRPPGYPFSLNSAVDRLLKKEFDIHRAKGIAHPLMEKYGVDAVPFAHEKMEEWRDSLRRGIKYFHEITNFIITGGVDDVWINPQEDLIIVDYKSTSKKSEVSIDADWQISYKRQMEIYQWLFRKNNFKVSDMGYFVYCNGNADKEAFDGKLEFDVSILPYKGNDSWIEEVILSMRDCLASDSLPKHADECDFCLYRKAVKGAVNNN